MRLTEVLADIKAKKMLLQADKTAGKAKLKELGLTDDQIAALVGYETTHHSIANTIKLQTPLPSSTADVPSINLWSCLTRFTKTRRYKEVQTEENPPPKIHFPPLPYTLPSQSLVAASILL